MKLTANYRLSPISKIDGKQAS